MPTVENSTVINAPVEKVFGFLADPKRFPDFFVGVVGVSDIKRTPEHVGDSSKITYAVAGIKIDVPSTIQEWEENKRIVANLGGAFPGRVSTTFEAGASGVKVTQRFDYTVGSDRPLTVGDADKLTDEQLMAIAMGRPVSVRDIGRGPRGSRRR